MRKAFFPRRCVFPASMSAASYVIATFVGLCLSSIAASQTNQNSWVLNGKVTNEKNEPLTGVSVRVAGSSRGGSTGEDGHFLIEIRSLRDSLSLSYVGYQTKGITPGSLRTIEVALEPAFDNDLLALDSEGELWRYKFDPRGDWILKK